ncbi:MAG TPA: hypothetical protein VH253_19310 [Phycisphaerae bacterium]|nr:hypothetical protein [Phycisphaerae bacterium]
MKLLLILFVVGSASAALADPIVLGPAPAKAPFTLSKDTTAITEPVNPDGTVDYVGAINQRAAAHLDPHDNGWALWVQLRGSQDIPTSTGAAMLRMAGADPLPATPLLRSYVEYLQQDKGLTANAAIAADDERVAASKRLWKPADFPDLADYLDSAKPALDLATRAARRPAWWIPAVSPDGSLMSVLLPGLASQRDVANTLLARATLRAGAGDFHGFLEDLLTVKRLARHPNDNYIICELVSIAIDAAADRTLSAVAASGTLTAPQVQELSDALAALPAADSVTRSVDLGERWMLLDTIAEIATGKLASMPADELFTDVYKSIVIQDVDWDLVLRQANAAIDDELALAAIPDYAKRKAAFADFQKKWTAAENPEDLPPILILAKKHNEPRDAYSHRVANGIISTLLPSLARAFDIERQQTLTENLTRTLLAAAAFKARTGGWPEKLSDLVPRDLPGLPRDFNKNLPTYALTPAGPQISAAADRALTLGAAPHP